MRGATLRQLRAFSLVARHLSFAQAAHELHLTPSAVSLQIKELEHGIGLTLFARGAKAIALTPAGDMLLVDVRRALLALEHADESLARLRDKQPGVVMVGMVSSAKYFLPRMLAQFHVEHRDVELQLSVGNRNQLIERLRRGEVELAVMGSPPGEMEGLGAAFADQPLGIIAPADHALNRQVAIPVEALAEQEFIVRESGSGTRAAMERFFRDAHIEPPRVMEMSSNEAIKQAVIASLGLAFLSLHSAMPELQGDLLVALDVVGLPLSRRWFIVQTDAKPLSLAAAALRDFILAHGGESIACLLGAPAVARVAPAVASLVRQIGMLPA